jgi:hypothetical protein
MTAEAFMVEGEVSGCPFPTAGSNTGEDADKRKGKDLD